MTNITLDRTLGKSREDTDRQTTKKSDSGIELGKIHMIPLSNIASSPTHPRKSLDDDSIIRLADSIRKHGILQPISLKYSPEKASPASPYQIIAGERRFRAAKLLGLSHIPCIMIKADDKRAAELGIIENLQREDLNMFEEACAIAALIDIYGLTQEETARILSSSQSFVANKLRILKLTLPEREKILLYGLSERHARALLRIASPEQRLRMIEYINLHSLNVVTTESYIDKYISDTSPSQRHSGAPRRIVLKDIRIFYNTINRAISIVKQAGIQVESQTIDLGETVELTIRVPKNIDVSRETSDLYPSDSE